VDEVAFLALDTALSCEGEGARISNRTRQAVECERGQYV
jgi:hypothetical protein